MDKVLDNEIVDSTKKFIKDRFNSSIYGTFIIFWLIFHWRFVYTALFVDQKMIWDSMHLFKNDYLVKTYFDYSDPLFYLWCALPIIFTILAVWVFPRLFVIAAYRREKEDETSKKIIDLKQKKDVIRAEAELEEQNVRKIAAVGKQIKEERKIKDADPTIEWANEYQNLKKKKIFEHFRTLYEMIYENQGGMYGKQDYQFATPLLAYLDSTEALVLDSGRIELKPKGNFFMRKYLEEVS